MTGACWLPAALPRSSRLADARTETWRLPADQMVTPAFTDAHIHLASAALAAEQPDLGGLDQAGVCRAIAAVHEERLAAGDADSWLLGHGWTFPALGAHPVAAWLDEAAPGRPVALWAHDHHSRWLSARAIQLAGLAATADPACGPHRARRGRPAQRDHVRGRGRAGGRGHPACHRRGRRLGRRILRSNAGGAGRHLGARPRGGGPRSGAARRTRGLPCHGGRWSPAAARRGQRARGAAGAGHGDRLRIRPGDRGRRARALSRRVAEAVQRRCARQPHRSAAGTLRAGRSGWSTAGRRDRPATAELRAAARRRRTRRRGRHRQ